jgi:hypothetical protein
VRKAAAGVFLEGRECESEDANANANVCVPWVRWGDGGHTDAVVCNEVKISSVDAAGP